MSAFCYLKIDAFTFNFNPEQEQLVENGLLQVKKDKVL